MGTLGNLKEEMNQGFEAKALVFLDNLCVFSFFPLLKACLRLGPAEVYYFQASGMGLKMAACFKTLRIISKGPIKVNDAFLNDTKDSVFLTSMFESLNICLKHQEEINRLVDKVLPKYDSYFRQVCAVGVRKEWQTWLNGLLIYLNAAKVLAREQKIPAHKVVFISQFASLLNILKVQSEISGHIKTYTQPFKNKAKIYLWVPMIYNMGLAVISLFGFFYLFKKEMSIPEKRKPVLGVHAAWGVGLEGSEKSLSDDFFWWRRTKIPSDQIVCLFDRISFQPTRNRLLDLEKMGVQAIPLSKNCSGDITETKVEKAEFSLAYYLKKVLFYFKLTGNCMFEDGFTQSAYSLVSWQIFKAEKLFPYYKGANLRGVFHIHEPGLEFVNLAALQNDAARIGTHWSCLPAPSSSSPKCQEIFFVWGEHDLKIILNSGSVSKNILVSGCPMTEHSHKEEFRKGQEALKSMQYHGARFTLALFDNSHPVPNFYRFFLQWLIDDPNLGIIVKSKGKAWDLVKKEGLGGLVGKALETGRLYVMDRKATPADAGLQTDFAVGITSISAIAVAALQGARVLYLDFEKLDQGPIKDYTIFHSLGPKQCVFNDMKSLKEAVLEYTENPDSNPRLGDASPILDKIDPFRDGKASQRMGEYATWYLEALSQNLSKEDAIHIATEKYSTKWGPDKVIRNL